MKRRLKQYNKKQTTYTFFLIIYRNALSKHTFKTKRCLTFINPIFESNWVKLFSREKKLKRRR